MNENKTTAIFNAITNIGDDIIEEVLTSVPQRKKKVFTHIKWAIIAACICLAVGVTAFAAANPAKFGLWRVPSSIINGLEMPQKIGNYILQDKSTLYVVPEGTDLPEAFVNSVYRATVFYYLNDKLDANREVRSELSVHIGATDEEYWSAYFGYDAETLNFISDDGNLNLRVEEYRGNTVYVYDQKWENSISRCATWLDEAHGQCFYVSLDDTSKSSPSDIMPYVQTVIDHMSSKK